MNIGQVEITYSQPEQGYKPTMFWDTDKDKHRGEGYYYIHQDEAHGPFEERALAIRDAQVSGYVEEKEMPYNFVTAYRCTREYGGPEEGGWWYDCYDPVCSIPVTSYKNAEEVKEFLELQLKHLAQGNIGSVKGGVEIHVYMELVQHEKQTKGKPQYE